MTAASGTPDLLMDTQRDFFAFFPDAEIDGQAENDDDDDDDDSNGNGQPLTTTISYFSKAFCARLPVCLSLSVYVTLLNSLNTSEGKDAEKEEERRLFKH